jgi:O-antigen ligase
LQVFGIYLSGSVTAFVGFVFGFIAFLFSLFRKRTAPIKIFSGLVIVVLLITIGSILSGNSTVLGFFESMWNNIDKSLHRVQLSTADSRIASYREALEYISRSPFIGIGTDQISTSGSVNRLLDVHNVFIQTWYVGGLLSLVGLLGIYIWISFSALKTYLSFHLGTTSPILIGLASTALAIIIMDQFQDALYQREKWLAFGLFSVILWSTRKATK